MQVPDFMAEIVATLTHLARSSPHINQRSGVSVRLSIANYETLVANAARRALRAGEPDVVPRVSDLDALAASTAGKVEIETLEEGRDEQVVERLLKAAVLTVFKERCPMSQFGDVVAAFDEGTVVHAGDDVASADYVDTLARMPVLKAPVMALAGSETPAAIASATEFVLEGLHLSKRLNKEAAGGRATYRGGSFATATSFSAFSQVRALSAPYPERMSTTEGSRTSAEQEFGRPTRAPHGCRASSTTSTSSTASSTSTAPTAATSGSRRKPS